MVNKMDSKVIGLTISEMTIL
jgi:hypothetical protein